MKKVTSVIDDQFEKLSADQISINQKEHDRATKIEAMNLSKDDMYFRLLEKYNYERIVDLEDNSQKPKYSYRCKYGDCERHFTKGWNILDHVRMHEGLRPYQCEFCDRSFTQKCNMKKHTRRHIITDLKDRKKFKCHVCEKGFTERYNLKVS